MTEDNRSRSVSVGLLREYDRPGPRYTSYPTAPVWSNKIDHTDYSEALKTASAKADAPLAIYCHIPFCRVRCHYCGCNTCVTKDSMAVEGYLDALDHEIKHVAKLLGDRRSVGQIHFGGGTPTYIGLKGLGRVLDRLEKQFKPLANCERSIEIDPRTTSREQLEFLTSRGFNRVSLGVQDFDRDVQIASGRVQPYEKVAEILKISRDLKFRGINFDLIYGLPRQTLESFNRSLDQVLTLRPDRLAVYSFAFLPSLKENQRKINADELPSTEVKYALFAAAVVKFTDAGYRQIGMDHFALPEDELSLAQSDGRLYRNFMGYSVQAAPDMIGFGMSSIGYVSNGFFQNSSDLGDYRKRIDKHGAAVYRGMRLSRDDLIRQAVITRLMCNFHLEYSSLSEQFGVDYSDYFALEHKQLKTFIKDGFLTENDRGLTVTNLGRTFVRNIAMTYDAYLSDDSDGKRPLFSRTI